MWRYTIAFAVLTFAYGQNSRLHRDAFVMDGHVHIVNRKTLEVIGSIGRMSPKPGDFRGLHTLATDSKGNLWTAETQPRPTGSRVQRFVFKGVS